MKNMYVYILLCSDKSYYTGVTNDLEHRLLQHHQGVNMGCYTFERRPLELMYFQIFDGPISAIAFEKKLKGWSRKKKQALIDENWPIIQELAICKNKTNHEFR